MANFHDHYVVVRDIIRGNVLELLIQIELQASRFNGYDSFGKDSFFNSPLREDPGYSKESNEKNMKK